MNWLVQKILLLSFDISKKSIIVAIYLAVGFYTDTLAIADDDGNWRGGGYQRPEWRGDNDGGWRNNYEGSRRYDDDDLRNNYGYPYYAPPVYQPPVLYYPQPIYQPPEQSYPRPIYQPPVIYYPPQ